MAIDYKRIDQLIQYVVAVASQEDGWDREVGKIHLIKYVYLADLSYAKSHEGQTYTGLNWIFHNFGPWSVECYNRIEPALEAINATMRTIESDKHDDFIRWSLSDERLFDSLCDKMDLVISGAIQKYFRKFGNDTYALLDFVYKTEPMLNAAPEEVLDFTRFRAADARPAEDKPKAELTSRQKKKQRQKLLSFKEKLNKKLEKKIRDRQADTCPIPPRYDDIFFEGLNQLDSAAGATLNEGRYIATFSEDVWKSKARHDPELS